ncbi:MAG: PhzF family phenazine biosynthesis protein [Rhodocyclales bacterium]|nr:PhzF family phenazine biosynthesis protein [Rhodocyclales bacterium]
MSPDFFIVDVFAERAYAGNPLAVVLGAERLSDETMQLLAAETNYSETTFVYTDPEANGGYRTRLFTPAREIAFAGHPILGTAWVIGRHLAGAAKDPVRLNLQVGEIPVYCERNGHGLETLWFDAPPISAGIQCDPARMALALGLAMDDIDLRYPVQVMSAGTAAAIVPLRSLVALRRALLDLKAYAGLMAEGFPPLTYLFCAETRSSDNDLSARFFFDAHGVREDPATGNGAAFLAGYLRMHEVCPREKRSWRIEQGHEVRRPSLVQIRIGTAADPGIQVGGGVLAAIQGNLIPG